MSRQLLLVDDDRTFCEVMARALSRRGFDVEVAHTPEEALALARERPPGFALVDLKMPNQSGLWLIPRLRAMTAHVRIVVLTGFASIATAVEAIKLGAVHYLAKPVDADEVVSAFQRDEGDPHLRVSVQPLSVERMEWEHIQRVLSAHSGNISATARTLRMHRRTLQRKLAKRPVRD
jgi:two-component system response regulator RegA